MKSRIKEEEEAQATWQEGATVVRMRVTKVNREDSLTSYPGLEYTIYYLGKKFIA